MILSTGHLPAISMQYSLIQHLVIHVFCYILLVTVKKYQMGSSRNEQLLSSKLVANQSRILNSHTAMVNPCLHSLWHMNPHIICGIHMVYASHLLVAVSVSTSTLMVSQRLCISIHQKP